MACSSFATFLLLCDFSVGLCCSRSREPRQYGLGASSRRLFTRLSIPYNRNTCPSAIARLRGKRRSPCLGIGGCSCGTSYACFCSLSSAAVLGDIQFGSLCMQPECWDRSSKRSILRDLCLRWTRQESSVSGLSLAMGYRPMEEPTSFQGFSCCFSSVPASY